MRQATASKETSKAGGYSNPRRNSASKFEVWALLSRMGPTERAESCWVDSGDQSGQSDNDHLCNFLFTYLQNVFKWWDRMCHVLRNANHRHEITYRKSLNQQVLGASKPENKQTSRITTHTILSFHSCSSVSSLFPQHLCKQVGRFCNRHDKQVRTTSNQHR